ncbi:hypothetical protein ASG40_02395 [Methylobacterium sp. Leaf399]|uniref:hypothetical protein n=1 Tax=Methylobacterium sp. Leaf399 TaxID=1736364 RepID=UPI0006F77F7E|nr:hypothetical protein ASF39_02380 [Methylobacterium sp. Leaf108]KQT20096.1 hypothetical protein ASG40_02395 [Methylobacterium sp. Leaf399]KQT80864.1 hypothetical protein ASG59_04815 [Methylobacterium sp. Leaf466]
MLLTAGLILGAGLAGAQARDGRNGALIGGAAAGVLGGVALGALMSGAQAAPPPPVYARPRPVYVEDVEPIYVRPPRREPICHMERRKVWLDDVEFTYRRVEVCE